MGKHDADERLNGSFLDGTEKVKDGALWLTRNLKTILVVALIPVIGFGAYYLTKYFVNKKKNNNAEPTYALAEDIKSDDKKEYYMGYEVLGKIQASNVGIDVKVLNPKLNGENYTEDALKNGTVLYYGEGLNKLGNTVVLGHNSSESFFGLKDLKVDDKINVTDQSGESKEYTVIEVSNCEPDDFSKFLPMEENSTEITLITCESDGTQRLVVKAITK